MDNIRNFVIIAHVDHGKSTLADRFLELTRTVEKRKMREQFLDQMELEREKGITIKMQPVRMIWRPPNHADNQLPVTGNHSNSEFILNLIDTPGHADFSYEVSRALAAVEGAILLVDATQGVQAQTLANLQMAQKENLVIIPAINKIDLASAEIEKTEEEISLLLGAEHTEIFRVSAKDGTGVEQLLRAVIEKVPPPKDINNNLSLITDRPAPLRALVFDSLYDPYSGVVAHIRVAEGKVKRGEGLLFLASGARPEAEEVGVFLPHRFSTGELSAGEIGYIATGIKEPEKVRVGDTITNSKFKIQNSKITEVKPLPGYKEPEPVVFASLFPENQDDYGVLRDSLKKLKLNDASLSFSPEDSGALGRGFRAGFLGMLHMEIVGERIQREYGIGLVLTNPSVAFRIKSEGEEKIVYAASRMPDLVEKIEEPWAKIEIIAPAPFLGAVTALLSERSGKITETSVLGGERLLIRGEAPLREVVVDFYDKLKSISQGFASTAYETAGYRKAKLLRLDILVAGERVAAFSEMVPEEKARRIGRERVERLKEILPRELFAVSLQASAGGRIIARETIPALRKDVTGYLYGGDRTRKMKLWKKQQKGKKRLKETGRVEISPEVFLKMIKPR